MTQIDDTRGVCGGGGRGGVLNGLKNIKRIFVEWSLSRIVFRVSANKRMSAAVKMSQTLVGSILSNPVYIRSTTDRNPSTVSPGPPT